MSQGWFKLHRELFEKSIWKSSTPEQKVILITLLGMANHQGKEWEWKGKQFKAMPGQFVTSIDSIIERSGKGISIQNVKSAIKRFEKYNFLTNESTKTGRLITIVNWGIYQGLENESNRQSNRQVTDNQPTSNQQVTDRSPTGNRQVTPNKNDKNVKNDNNDKERGEGEENIPPTPPPNLSPIQEKILNSLGPVSYKTWIANTEINEQKDKVIFIAPSNFAMATIRDRFKDKLEISLGKQIEVKEE